MTLITYGNGETLTLSNDKEIILIDDEWLSVDGFYIIKISSIYQISFDLGPDLYSEEWENKIQTINLEYK